MTPGNISVFLFLLLVAGSSALRKSKATRVQPTPAPDDGIDDILDDDASNSQPEHQIKIAKRIKETIKTVKQLDGDFITKQVHTNFMHSLFQMANASAIAGTNVSRAAATIIRGFVQDSFNLVSISAYFPRLIFLDGPSQFIETLRLVRAGQIRIPMDMDSAIDTLINFASQVRSSQITMNVATPFFAFFPNVFRGAELLASKVLFQVFGWLAPINPEDVALPAVEGLWQRWDTKSSTTDRYDYNKQFITTTVHTHNGIFY